MARKKETTVNGMKFTFQSISPQSYYGINDEYLTGKKRDTAGYLDALIRNVVVEPKEVNAEGLGYFDENDDIGTSEKLLTAIESFLRERK